jgi:hypothetical protein
MARKALYFCAVHAERKSSSRRGHPTAGTGFYSAKRKLSSPAKDRRALPARSRKKRSPRVPENLPVVEQVVEPSEVIELAASRPKRHENANTTTRPDTLSETEFGRTIKSTFAL